MKSIYKWVLLVVLIMLLVALGIWLFDKLTPPMGEKFVFSNDNEICVIGIHGWHKRCLTEGSNPTWSPDGQYIAFEMEIPKSEVVDPRFESSIAIINIDGSEIRRLTDNGGHDITPAWSPDGQVIAFRSNRHGLWELFQVKVNDGEPEQLTVSTFDNYEPAWSPDGQKIAFSARASVEERFDIFVMDADGGNVKRLTTDPAFDRRPTWSPDGQKIAFESDRDGNWEIYVMDNDGSNQTRLTYHHEADRGPAWSPDGTQIAFVSARSGRTVRLILHENEIIPLYDIYIMNTDGTDVKRITHGRYGTYKDLGWSSQ